MSFSEKLYQNFIEDDRWLLLVNGLKVTILVTLFALLVGVIIGFTVAIIRSLHDKTGKFKILNAICKVYLTIIRGTPSMIQVLFMYLVVFGASSLNSIVIGGLAFGINSGAYVAEIVRSGIMAIPEGQTEAGRSLGFSYGQTMRLIIMPQAFKNVLPALVNEMIVLIKETAIIGYIGEQDLTKAAMVIQSRTFEAFIPLITAAVIYLALVMLLTFFMNKLKGDCAQVNDKNEVLIQVQDLKKAFGKLEVLRGISTEIKKGEVVVVIGPSGSGKSTFLRSLNLLEVTTGGTVLFEGTDITDTKTDIDVHRQKI